MNHSVPPGSELKVWLLSALNNCRTMRLRRVNHGTSCVTLGMSLNLSASVSSAVRSVNDTIYTISMGW